MNFIIVSGPNLTDYQSIELIKKELQLKQIKYKTITDKEFLSENLTDKFIISVGGPAVNELSIIIKSIYKKKIDLSCYGSTSYNNFYGSQNGVIMNNYNIGGCIAFWGEEALDTLNCAKYFVRENSILEDIIKNFDRWTSLYDLTKKANSSLNNTNKKFGLKLRGVNLGGWLVLEKWISPSLFRDLSATDETSLCVELGNNAEKRLINHWSNFITESDFEWISNIGLNAIRIPVGYWIFGPPYPYHHKFGNNKMPFVVGGIEFLDKAFDWAEKYNLYILLDLHAAPGCQNGFDNGGMLNVCDWHKNKEYIDFTVELLEKLAFRYGKRENLIGIEALNEPHWNLIPIDILKNFFIEAYYKIRKHTNKYEVAFVFNDLREDYFHHYKNFLQEPEYSNVVFDIHRYQCFVEADTRLDFYGHITKTVNELKQEIENLVNNLGLWIYVGEWSLGLNKKVVSIFEPTNAKDPLINFDNFSKSNAYRSYGSSQLIIYEKCKGWFFWTYKTENVPEWNFRECVERGWLPNNYSF